MRFDLSTIPAGSIIVEARFQMVSFQGFAYGGDGRDHVHEVADDSWEETTITWNNQQTGNYGSVTPVQTYEPEPGRYCREFQQQVVIGGKQQDAYGTACRQPDGSWEIVAEQP